MSNKKKLLNSIIVNIDGEDVEYFGGDVPQNEAEEIAFLEELLGKDAAAAILAEDDDEDE